MLKYQLDSLDGLEDGIAALYTEKDGKYVLQVEGVVGADVVDGLKTQLQDAKNESIDRRKQLAIYEGIGKPDEIQTKLSEAAKGKNPDHDRIIAEMKASHEAAMAEAHGQLSKERKAITTERLKSELAKAGFIPDALDSIATLAAAQIEHTEDGMRIVKDGKPMIGSGSDGGATLGDLAKSLAETHTYALQDQGKGGGGTPQNKGGTPGNKTMERGAFDAMGQHDRGQFIKDGGKVVDP